MNDLALNRDFQGMPVRIVGDAERPLFVAADVCAVLGIGNHRKALVGLDGDERDCVTISDAIGRDRETSVVTEAGLYHLIFKSRKAEAVAFRRWVTGEGLPEIRKSGGYQMPGVAVLGLRGWVQVDESCTLGELAGRIRDAGIDCGLKRLVKVLKREGMLERVGERAGLPTLEAEQRGLMVVERFRRVDANASIVTTEVPRVTAKGQMEFFGLVRGEKGGKA